MRHWRHLREAAEEDEIYEGGLFSVLSGCPKSSRDIRVVGEGNLQGVGVVKIVDFDGCEGFECWGAMSAKVDSRI